MSHRGNVDPRRLWGAFVAAVTTYTVLAATVTQPLIANRTAVGPCDEFELLV